MTQVMKQAKKATRRRMKQISDTWNGEASRYDRHQIST
jgi:hypothetical protein